MSWGFEFIDVHARPSGCAPLVGLSLGARVGQVTALVGPPGSGTTTAFRLAAGLERLDAGAVLVAGKDISRAREPQRRRLRRRTAVVFGAAGGGDHALFAAMSAEQNVRYAMRAAGRVPRRREEAVAREELDRFGLGAVADLRPAGLSAAQRKRLALARAVALRAPFVLVDGLEDSLDSVTAHAVGVEVRAELGRRGQTWLVTTADAALAARVADVVVHL